VATGRSLLQALPAGPRSAGHQPSHQPGAADAAAPGLAVLLNLMSGRQLEKALLQHVLHPGQEELAVRHLTGCFLTSRCLV